ncbi:signal peptidase II [Oceanicella actignis]|uniref:Lipoprotein signal peptidase n=1 Tax=Oceanicella actignis TaxID=1189325 RepID=A0A1M7TJD2_9RHOB|nr:signal peptidase II [Oceanicella actignis]TYO88158.1 signal peptidase II [Oceanicella actignis]SET66255.1 signal peptidase II [Oceanicella actignis]SHN70821.1 signal peptidase II [Oceanicella actignis]
MPSSSAAATAAALLAFAIDRLSKWWVLDWLDLPARRAVEVLPPWLNLVMAWNRGVNFGLGDGVSRWVWAGLALALSAGLAWWARGMRDGTRAAAAGLMIGGALSNALDRVLYGAVVDFLNMSCCGLRNPYAFNPADIFIFVGAAGLILREGSDKQAA